MQQTRFISVAIALGALLPATAAPGLQPPPAPDLPPLIARSYSNDADGNRIDDRLWARHQHALLRKQRAVTAGERAAAEAELAGMMDVELIFTEPVTQSQLDRFRALGGEITHLYRAVSYGWNGRIPLEKIPALPPLMGATLVLVDEPRLIVRHMDLATRTGRVRPLWAAGVDGDSSITIAIIDTGVDESHTDLAGRRVYWMDFSTDNAPNPVDVLAHGSHVAGIALGTGAAGGAGTGTLLFTQEGDLSGVPANSFFPSPIDLPATPLSWSMIARWLGGANPNLHLASHPKGSSGGWTSEGSTSGTSPISLTVNLTGNPSRAYSPALLKKGNMSDFVITCQVSNYPGVGDGFNKFRGVAPGCNWAAAKVFSNAGSGFDTWINAAIDDLVSKRVALNVKVINLSIGIDGNPGLAPSLRQKVNTAVHNGIVVCVSAGNDGGGSSAGAREIDDPGRAAMALTVAAANDNNQLTDYTSHGFSSPGSTAGQEEDFKPDLMAPGGSFNYYTGILSVDSNSADGAFTDQQTNDYANLQGTSMSSPFAAGAAALVIDALQQHGTVWDFNSSTHSRRVKMLLCATASESNANRENGSFNPTLQRAAPGPSGFPPSKDPYEGYGLINPDAAVEAATLTLPTGSTVSAALGPATTDRRVWARTVNLLAGQPLTATLTVPGTGDFDLYLYSNTPTGYGTPTILASSTQPGNGVGESISHTPAASATALLAVKRVAGSGTFTLQLTGPAQADLALGKTATPEPVVQGYNLTYSLAVSNAGPATATAVTATDPLPAGTAFVSASPGCSHAAGTVTCDLGSLSTGSSTTVTIVVTATVAGSITNTASATSAVSDPNPANNSAAAITTVQPDSDGDGLPDWWEQLYFGNPTAAAAGADSDADSQSNLAEYLADTDPTDPASALRITAIEQTGAGVSISFTTRPGRFYNVRWTTELAAPAWNTLTNAVAGTGGVVQVGDTGAASQPKRHYRVELAPQ